MGLCNSKKRKDDVVNGHKKSNSAKGNKNKQGVNASNAQATQRSNDISHNFDNTAMTSDVLHPSEAKKEEIERLKTQGGFISYNQYDLDEMQTESHQHPTTIEKTERYTIEIATLPALPSQQVSDPSPNAATNAIEQAGPPLADSELVLHRVTANNTSMNVTNAQAKLHDKQQNQQKEQQQQEHEHHESEKITSVQLATAAASVKSISMVNITERKSTEINSESKPPPPLLPQEIKDASKHTTLDACHALEQGHNHDDDNKNDKANKKPQEDTDDESSADNNVFSDPSADVSEDDDHISNDNHINSYYQNKTKWCGLKSKMEAAIANKAIGDSDEESENLHDEASLEHKSNNNDSDHCNINIVDVRDVEMQEESNAKNDTQQNIDTNAEVSNTLNTLTTTSITANATNAISSSVANPSAISTSTLIHASERAYTTDKNKNNEEANTNALSSNNTEKHATATVHTVQVPETKHTTLNVDNSLAVDKAECQSNMAVCAQGNVVNSDIHVSNIKENEALIDRGSSNARVEEVVLTSHAKGQTHYAQGMKKQEHGEHGQSYEMYLNHVSTNNKIHQELHNNNNGNNNDNINKNDNNNDDGIYDNNDDDVPVIRRAPPPPPSPPLTLSEPEREIVKDKRTLEQPITLQTSELDNIKKSMKMNSDHTLENETDNIRETDEVIVHADHTKTQIHVETLQQTLPTHTRTGDSSKAHISQIHATSIVTDEHNKPIGTFEQTQITFVSSKNNINDNKTAQLDADKPYETTVASNQMDGEDAIVEEPETVTEVTNKSIISSSSSSSNTTSSASEIQESNMKDKYNSKCDNQYEEVIEDVEVANQSNANNVTLPIHEQKVTNKTDSNKTSDNNELDEEEEEEEEDKQSNDDVANHRYHDDNDISVDGENQSLSNERKANRRYAAQASTTSEVYLHRTIATNTTTNTTSSQPRQNASLSISSEPERSDNVNVLIADDDDTTQLNRADNTNTNNPSQASPYVFDNEEAEENNKSKESESEEEEEEEEEEEYEEEEDKEEEEEEKRESSDSNYDNDNKNEVIDEDAVIPFDAAFPTRNSHHEQETPKMKHQRYFDPFNEGAIAAPFQRNALAAQQPVRRLANNVQQDNFVLDEIDDALNENDEYNDDVIYNKIQNNRGNETMSNQSRTLPATNNNNILDTLFSSEKVNQTSTRPKRIPPPLPETINKANLNEIHYHDVTSNSGSGNASNNVSNIRRTELNLQHKDQRQQQEEEEEEEEKPKQGIQRHADVSTKNNLDGDLVISAHDNSHDNLLRTTTEEDTRSTSSSSSSSSSNQANEREELLQVKRLQGGKVIEGDKLENKFVTPRHNSPNTSNVIISPSIPENLSLQESPHTKEEVFEINEPELF